MDPAAEPTTDSPTAALGPIVEPPPEPPTPVMLGPVLDGALTRWHAADLITSDQVDGIRAYEHARGGPGSPPPPPAAAADAPAEGRSSLVAEGLAYIGAGLALGAGFAVFGELWADLDAAARVILAIVGTAIVGSAAFALRDQRGGSVERLTTVLSALMLVGVALTVAVTLDEYSQLQGDWVALLSGAAALVVAVPVHRARASWPTTLAMGAALLTVVFGSEQLLGLSDGPFVLGVTLMGIGLAWAAAGWSGMVRPRSAFEVTGLLTGGVGVQILAFDELTVTAMILGLVISAAALAVGLTEDRTSPAVLGGLGITVFSPQLVFQLFGETIGGPLALFVGGVALVAVATTILRQKEST